MARTRSGKRAQALQELPLDPSLLVHVFAALRVHHGEGQLDKASAVCTTWRERVDASHQIEEEPDNMVGELRSGDKPYRFDRPHDAVFLPNGDICVADCDNFRLQVVTREGYHQRDVRLSGGTSCPTGVALSGEHLFVVEHGTHRVCKLRRVSGSGHRHATAGSWGGGDGELRHPWGVAVSAERGLVYVSDQGNDRICVFSADTLAYITSFGETGGRAGQLREPRGLVITETELYVADSLNHRVQIFKLGADGLPEPAPSTKPSSSREPTKPSVRCLGGGESKLAGRFNCPSGLAIASGNLYVAELGGHRLQVLTLDGLPLQAVAFEGPISGVAADEELICVTCLEGSCALSLYRAVPQEDRLVRVPVATPAPKEAPAAKPVSKPKSSGKTASAAKTAQAGAAAAAAARASSEKRAVVDISDGLADDALVVPQAKAAKGDGHELAQLDELADRRTSVEGCC